MSGPRQRGRDRRRRLALCLAICLAPAVQAQPAGAEAKAIQGTIRVEPGLAGQIAAGDRLVIKLFHPDAGGELDPQYRMIDDFSRIFVTERSSQRSTPPTSRRLKVT